MEESGLGKQGRGRARTRSSPFSHLCAAVFDGPYGARASLEDEETRRGGGGREERRGRTAFFWEEERWSRKFNPPNTCPFSGSFFSPDRATG